MILNSATVKPMLSSAWQARQDPDDADRDPDAGRFVWDGNFAANKAVLGSWRAVDLVETIDAFDPANKRGNAHRARIKAVTLKKGGRTDRPLWIWSGDMLMDLYTNQALKMVPKTVGGVRYLFIEAGGFNTKHAKAWRSPLCVLKSDGNCALMHSENHDNPPEVRK